MNKVTSPGPGRPKDMEKRAAILAAAQELFACQSFEGTSMDAVASAAGVSKLTVYSHFGDKDNLFREVIRGWMDEYLPEATYEFDPELDMRANLMRVALTHAGIDCSKEAVGTFRAIMSDCRQGKPRYGKLMWEEGVMRNHRLLGKLLEQANRNGRLHIEDVPRATVQFMSLVKGDLLIRRLLGCERGEEEYERELRAVAVAGVEAFLRAYQPR